MKKEDYMKLSKERLAELLEEKDKESRYVPSYPPIIVSNPNPPCYAPDGICTNPQHDCVNCPRTGGGGTWTTNTGGTGYEKKL